MVLHGLACGSEYHFQPQSTDSSNNTTAGADGTFTTAGCPGVPQSDEFNGTAIDLVRWTLVDPAGGAVVGAAGGQGRISLPAGVAHDTWTNNDKVARLMQPAPDDNFEMLAKFDSAVSLSYQMQGFLVQQDTDDLLRLEVHREGAFTNLFAASIAAGVASDDGKAGHRRRRAGLPSPAPCRGSLDPVVLA